MPSARKKASPSAPPNASDTFVSPDELHFDLSNPRFVDGQAATEVEIVKHLVDEADVDELVQSILSAGYIDYEPLIVLRDGNVVLEGNRRLAALRLISDEDLREQSRFTLPDIADSPPLPQEVRVRYVDSRSEARSFIGFKHINGPFKWDALAKAKYAAEWFDEGHDIGPISRTLGDNHHTVRRLVNGWYALQQAQGEGFDINQISKKTFSFSHLYTALTRSSVREYLGLGDEDPSSEPRKKPVPKKHASQLLQLMSWLYGQEQKGEPALVRSQNPDLNILSKVLGHPEGKKMLLAKRDLQVAYARVEPASSRFEDALLKASKQCEDALSLAGAYDGDDSTLFKVAEGMQRTVRSLVVAMKESTESAQGAS